VQRNYKLTKIWRLEEGFGVGALSDSEARFIACSLKTSTVPCDVTILPQKLTVLPVTSLCVKQLILFPVSANAFR